MKNLSLRGGIAFGVPVLLVSAVVAFRPEGFWFLAAGPLCGFIGGLALGRRWGLSIVLGFSFALVSLMFSLQENRSALFTDVIWTGFVSAFLFWVVGGCAALTLPAHMRFNAAAALAVPGALAGMAFQFFYGPGHFLFGLASREWWGNAPWEHLLLWLIAGAGGGWVLGQNFETRLMPEERAFIKRPNRWALASLVFGSLGLGIGAAYFLRSALPLGLINSLSPASAAADWLWGWGLLSAGTAAVALFTPRQRMWTAAGAGLALALVAASYRVEASPWKTQFNIRYAERLLRETPASGDAIYTGNLILAQAALDNADVASAKRYLLEAAATPGAKRITENGLDVSVARALFDRGEKDAVLEYLRRGRELWPEGAQTIARWEAAIQAGRRPNFNTRGPGGGRGNLQTR